ncbi:MAG: methyltransferase domain-containing protein [Burkholderiales bacterium]|nr:methyltransferase domain-containing protein [Burkholderiales bacterium]
MIENKPGAANVETVHNIEELIQSTLSVADSFPNHLSDSRANDRPRFFPETPEILNVQIVSLPSESVSEGQSRLRARLNKLFSKDLSVKEKIRATPLLGYALAWVNALVKLPVTRHHHQVDIDLLHRKLALNDEKITHVNARLSAAQSYIDARVELLNHEVNSKIDAIRNALESRLEVQEKIDASFRLKEIEEIQCATRLYELESVRSAARLHEIESVRSAHRLHSMEMLDIGTRLMKLEQIEGARKLKHYARLLQMSQKESSELKNQVDQLSVRLAQMHVSDDLPVDGRLRDRVDVPNNNVQIDSLKKASFDQFFSDFEDAFRGERAEIKRRLEVYLPYVREVMSPSAGQSDFHLIDVGCGRGEWLELMTDQGMSALGIDLNEQKVKACIDVGLAAKTADAISFLREQEVGSLSVVTGFHIIEHLPFETLIALFDAALAALKPGGIVIFETPNPENLLVGSCNFYFDPTHLNPIVPAVAQFMATQRGFSHAEIMRLHPYPDDHLAHGETEVDHIVNRYLFGAQDYALIARK